MEAVITFILLIVVTIYLIRKQRASSAQTGRIVNHLKTASRIKYPSRKVPFDSKTATLKECVNAAKQGHPEAQFKLGEYYFKRESIRLAEQWFALASAQGRALATAYLGILAMMHNTHGSNAVAVELFKAAHAQVEDDSSLPEDVKPLARQQILNTLEATLKQDREPTFIPFSI